MLLFFFSGPSSRKVILFLPSSRVPYFYLDKNYSIIICSKEASQSWCEDYRIHDIMLYANRKFCLLSFGLKNHWKLLETMESFSFLFFLNYSSSHCYLIEVRQTNALILVFVTTSDSKYVRKIWTRTQTFTAPVNFSADLMISDSSSNRNIS